LGTALHEAGHEGIFFCGAVGRAILVNNHRHVELAKDESPRSAEQDGARIPAVALDLAVHGRERGRAGGKIAGRIDRRAVAAEADVLEEDEIPIPQRGLEGNRDWKNVETGGRACRVGVLRPFDSTHAAPRDTINAAAQPVLLSRSFVASVAPANW